MKTKRGFSYKVNRRSFLNNGVILAIAFFLAGTLVIPKSIYGDQKEVKVGLLTPTSGGVAPLGIQVYRGLEMGVDEVNESGGIKSLGGAKIKIVLADTRSLKDFAVTALQRLIEQDVVCIVCGAGSAEGMVTAPICEKNRMTMLLAVPIADEILQTVPMKYVFRITIQARKSCSEILKQISYVRDKSGAKLKNMVITYEHAGYGVQIYNEFLKVYKNFGFNMVGAFPYQTGIADLSPILMKVKALQPDFLFDNGYTGDAILLTRTLKELNINLNGYYLDLGPSEKIYQDTLKEDAEYAMGHLYWHETIELPGVKKGRCKEIADRFRRRYGFDMDGQGSRAFTIAYLIKDVLERSGSTDKEKFRDALATTELTAAKGNILPYESVKFDGRGENINVTLCGMQMLDGKPELFWPEQYATKKFVYPFPTWEERRKKR